MSFWKTLVIGETLTRENFAQPPVAMGILPFWFWNGNLDEDELEWQLREYQKKGIPGIFIHGRFGLKVPYVSDKWFEKVRFVVQKAKEIGIDVWVYDEMNWPSGTAERQVLKKYPHLSQRYLELVALNVDGPLFTFLEATDSRYVNTGNSHPIAAFGCTEDEYQHGIHNLIDLTQNLSFEKVIPWEAPPGKWRLLYFLEKEVPYYIDALSPESTERFIEITHERYKSAVGKEFGNIVPGFFTDEPAMHYYQVGVDNYVVPWSKQMFKIFREKRGYDLRPYLPALFASMGPKTASIRYDFWLTLTEQYSERYYARLRQWCDANGVLFTGHLLFEEWLRLQVRCEGNIFKHLRHMHIIGVDHLYPKIGTEQEPDQHVALKIGSSAAHHFGSTRLLCESMGGSYWDCTLERMKWMANWEYVLGVNLFNNHGYHYSIEGERKRDWPPSQFYHHTWWKHYDRFTAYVTRLSHTLSGGRHVAKVLMLYPIASIWTNYIPQARTPLIDVIESDFNYLTDTLLRLHYDFDYVDEDVLAEAKIGKGTITIRDEEYSVFILPPVTHIKRTTYEALRKFLNSGGNVIADSVLPVEFLETEKKSAAKDVQRLFGVDPLKLLRGFEKPGSGVLALHHRNTRGNVFVLKGKGLYRLKAKQQLRSILERCAAPDVTIDDEEIFYLHRIKDGLDIYFLVNTSRQEKDHVEITFERVGQPELWDPSTGMTSPIHVYRISRGRLSLTLDFPPSEARIIVLSGPVRSMHIEQTNIIPTAFDGKTVIGYGNPDAAPFATIARRRERKKLRAKKRKPLPPIVFGKKYHFTIEQDNVLVLSQWRMKIVDERSSGGEYHKPEFDDREWLSVTNGAWEIQLPQEREVASYPVSLWYRTSFNIVKMPLNTRLMIDGFSGSEFHLYVNGQHVRETGNRSWLDSEIKEVAVQRHLLPGKNLIAVNLRVGRRTDGILDLLKIVGEFAVTEQDGRYVVTGKDSTIRIGDWTRQGYPFYSGTGVYRTEVTVPRAYVGGKFLLEVDCGEDVLEVSVNGSRPLVVPWHPYRLDVTDLIREGKNSVELKVTNTLINLLEGVQKASGLFSPPRLVHYNVYTFPSK